MDNRKVDRSRTCLTQTNNRMQQWLDHINHFLYRDFIFSDRFRVWRHVIYWSFHITIWALFWTIMDTQPVSFGRNVFKMILWLPVFLLFSYPLVYYAIPQLLLKGKIWQFLLLVLSWGLAGLYLNLAYRNYVYVPVQEWLGLDYIPPKGHQPQGFLCMTTSAASPMIIKFFKSWTQRQQARLGMEREKLGAELQLLKAQVHPHFLFNTLNHIHALSMQRSPRTPALILKLSSLLSYMLYDCKAEEVRLEKEIGVMRHYIDLERERLDNKVELSWSVEGNTRDQFIAPLLLLPALEHAFRHCAAEAIQKPWMALDISVKKETIRCKIAHSKEERALDSEGDTGIRNLRKRVGFIYPANHELKLNDEGSFFVLSLLKTPTSIA